MSNLIAIKPLSQTKQARRNRQLLLDGDPKAAQYQETAVRNRRKKIDAKKRFLACKNYTSKMSMKRWNEVARSLSLGRDSGAIAVRLGMPEWIVKILSDHIKLAQQGVGTPSDNLRAANEAIIVRRNGGKK